MGYSADVGLMNIWIDDLVPYLKDNENGELKETFVYRIQSKSFLKHFREDNGWYINWDEIPAGVEVYALALQEDANAIQGLIGIVNDQEAKAAYLHWGCTAPWNNKHDHGTQRYSGIGGHLFAIGAEKSMEWGYNGATMGLCMPLLQMKSCCITTLRHLEPSILESFVSITLVFLNHRHRRSGRCIVLNGHDKKKLPKFLEGESLPEGYYDPVSPYEKHPPCPYNLQELMKFSVTSGRKIEDMSKEELNQFAV